jgi:hypothetical protein
VYLALIGQVEKVLVVCHHQDAGDDALAQQSSHDEADENQENVIEKHL